MTTGRVSILERPVYGMSEAAGLLGLRPDRARTWLDGYQRRGTRYPPVIRMEPTGDDVVTWGELVELGYLREYRHKGVPLQVRGFVLTGRRSQSTADSLAILARHWRTVDRLASARSPGPWMYAVTEERLRRVELG